MSAFTNSELDYLSGQPLDRIATVQRDGTPQVSPVTFRYNGELDSIDISGYRLADSKKFRNIAENGRVAFVADDLASVRPWHPRCVEIRGHAEAIADSPVGPIIRIQPKRIISFGIDETDTPAHSLAVNARDVG